jgi:hypothetical protein
MWEKSFNPSERQWCSNETCRDQERNSKLTAFQHIISKIIILFKKTLCQNQYIIHNNKAVIVIPNDSFCLLSYAEK